MTLHDLLPLVGIPIVVAGFALRRNPLLVVLVAAIEAAARVLRVVATRQGRRPPALRGRDGWGNVCRPGEGGGGER